MPRRTLFHAPGGMLLIGASASAFAQVPARPAEQLTLLAMVEQGGVILWIILALAFFALVMALYLLATVSSGREAPKRLVRNAFKAFDEDGVRALHQIVQDREELIAHVFRAGVRTAGHDRFVIQEAMESEGERGATRLWQRIIWLNHIATLAPLLGLLGTVWGMMQAFGAIALDTAQTRNLSMAYSVAQAMVTTAAGLAVAIPAMTIYFVLRGRVIRIVAAVEAYASELLERLSGDRNGANSSTLGS